MLTRTAVGSMTLSLMLFGLAGPALAQLWNGPLKNTAVQNFTDEDMRLFTAAWHKALDESPEHGTVHWENPATKSQGDVTVASAFTWQNHACRRLRVVSEARGNKSDSLMDLCRVDDKWRMVSPSELQKKGR
jgi:surface antigen